MSFWESYRGVPTDKRFQPIKRGLLPPIKIHPLVARTADVPELTAFLTTYFGDAQHPVLKPVLKVGDQELILYTRTTQGIQTIKNIKNIQATIRYKYAGTFEGQPIYLIDCFCAKERRTGIASQLLSALHAKTEHIPSALFLKEGRPVPGQDPLYTSYYMYRRRRLNAISCLFLSPLEAYALVNTYRRVHKDMFWLANVDNPNQYWRLWKRGSQWSLACFQDSFQEKEGQRIGWMTAFVGNTATGIEALADACPFPWIWADQCWITETERWTLDGPFHWYTYRWTTSLRPTTGLALRCYGIVV
jgi:hypothetical protein